MIYTIIVSLAPFVGIVGFAVASPVLLIAGAALCGLDVIISFFNGQFQSVLVDVGFVVASVIWVAVIDKGPWLLAICFGLCVAGAYRVVQTIILIIRARAAKKNTWDDL